MGKRPYVCLYTSYLQTFAPFTDEERGRIIMAMLQYSSDGECPVFSGNERFIWPTLQAQIDRDAAVYDELCARNRRNGKKGGRPGNQVVSTETGRLFPEPKKPKEKEKDKEKKNEKDKKKEKENVRRCFVPPTPEEVRGYCEEAVYTNVDPERFVDFYASKGWKVGSNPMKDWKAAVRNWNRREKSNLRPETADIDYGGEGNWSL